MFLSQTFRISPSLQPFWFLLCIQKLVQKTLHWQRRRSFWQLFCNGNTLSVKHYRKWIGSVKINDAKCSYFLAFKTLRNEMNAFCFFNLHLHQLNDFHHVCTCTYCVVYRHIAINILNHLTIQYNSKQCFFVWKSPVYEHF